jgi:hypothetical protein
MEFPYYKMLSLLCYIPHVLKRSFIAYMYQMDYVNEIHVYFEKLVTLRRVMTYFSSVLLLAISKKESNKLVVSVLDINEMSCISFSYDGWFF